MTKQTVKVVVRVKPNEQEDLEDESVTVIQDPQNSAIMLKKSSSDDGLYQFNFNRAIKDSSQTEVYEIVGQDVVSSVLEGYNGTIMAYGQTGSGKTYTMTGPEDVPLYDQEMQGIMPRAIKQVFHDILRSRIPLWSVQMTYLEIYNESFKDLLTTDTKADIIIQESRKGVISLRNVQSVTVDNFEQAMKHLQQAQKQRAVAGHDMNKRSSRSHTILTIWITLTDESGATTRAKLNMVDLAGSERAGKTGAKGKSLKEATHINKSLTFLEQVIVALSSKREKHVPYRSSKLTHFLKDSIGGNCKTTLVACCWGNKQQFNETLSTCRFADRMSKIHVTANKNTGLNSIHGSLFKLDPKMQCYLEQTTAAAVAREKAKLLAHLRRKGQLVGDGNIDFDEHADLEETERQELGVLREKVKDLEQLQSDIHAHKGAEIVDEATAAEIEELRRKLLEMELERQHELMEREMALKDVEPSHGAELHQLKQRVNALKQQEQLSVQELVELQELRTQVIRLQELEFNCAPVPLNPPTIQQQQQQEEIDYLQQRMETLQTQLDQHSPQDVSQQDVQELIEIRNRLEELYVDATRQENQQEQLQQQFSGDLSAQYDPQQIVLSQIGAQFANLQKTVEELKTQLNVRNAVTNNIPIINTPQMSLPMQQSADDFSVASGQLSHNQFGHHSGPLTEMDSKKKKKKFPKMLRKLFGKKKKGNNSAFSDPYLSASAFHEDQGQNIVILNSLTHNQLTELLRAHNLSGQQYDQLYDGNQSEIIHGSQLLEDLGTQTNSKQIEVEESEKQQNSEKYQKDEFKQKFQEQPLKLPVDSENKFIKEQQYEEDSSPASASTPNNSNSENIDDKKCQNIDVRA